MKFDNEENFLYSGSKSGDLILWDLRTEILIQKI